MIFLSLLGSLIPLIIFGGIIWAIVKAVQSRADGPQNDGDASLRKFFVYVLLYGAFVAILTGILSLVDAVFPPGVEIARSASTDVARGLALVIVGGPVYWFTFRMVQRAFAADSAESRGIGWSLYLNAALATSLIGAIVAFTQSISLAIGADPLQTANVGAAIVWSAAWAIHWFVLIPRHGIRTDVHLAVGSAIGLGLLATGLGLVLNTGFDAIYEAMFATTTAGPQARNVLDMPVAVTIVGAAVWTIHWLSRYIREARTTLWHTYVVIGGVLVGLITAVVGGAILIGTVLQWWFGSPGTDLAVEHFASLPGALAAMVIGLAVWSYHRSVLNADGVPQRTEPMRVHDYIAAAVGLVAALVGLTTIIVALLEAVTGPSAFAGARPENTLVVAVTALIVGAPLWWYMWSRTERLGEEERRSPSRKAYVVGILGVSAITAAVSLAIMLFVLLEDILDGVFGTRTVYDFRVALALLIALSGVAWYHFQVRRRDESVAPADAPVRVGPREILVVGGDGKRLDELIERTGARVSHWTRLDESEIADLDLDGLVQQLTDIDTARVMVVLDGGEPQIIPYSR